MVPPSALSLLTASFPEGEKRAGAVAWYAATAGIGASLGMLLGGAAAPAAQANNGGPDVVKAAAPLNNGGPDATTA